MEHSLHDTISLLTRTPLLSMRFCVIYRKLGHSEMKVKALGACSMSSAISFTTNTLIGCRARRWCCNLVRPRLLSLLIVGDRNERAKASRRGSYWMNLLVCGQKTWTNCVH